jgi:ribulose-phosphate 3-epimerase
MRQPHSGFALCRPGLRVAPSLLAADFARLAEQVAAVEAAGAEVLHLDVMDGHFVPNISFGIPVIASLRKRSRMFFDAHLMIADPMRYAESFVKAGCDHLTFHAETVEDPERVIEHVRSLGASVGVSLNPATSIESIEKIVDDVDMVLVMSVWPGFGGQTFIADVLPKVEVLRDRLGSHQRLEIDGGIDVDTVAIAARAGADVLVAGSAVFGQPDPVGAMKELHCLAEEAVKAGRGRVEPHAANHSGD